MPTRIQDLFTYALLVFVLVIAFFGINGCAAVAPLGPEWQDRAAAAVSTVLVRDGDKRCSGVAIADFDVLTAAHCVDDGGPLTVETFPGGAPRGASILATELEKDLALVRVEGEPLEAQAKPAAMTPTPGSVVFSAGFGCFGELAVAPGLVIGPRPGVEHSIMFAMEVCYGDSGGPVFDDEGGLFAIVTEKGTTAPITFATTVLE